VNVRISVVLALAAAAALIGCGPPNYIVMTEDMAPALEQGDIVAIDSGAYEEASPERGDIVSYHAPDEPKGKALMGRVVALAGETVSVEDGALQVDGGAVEVPWAGEEMPFETDAVQVPGAHVYILGDNREEARDSHVFGPVPVESIVGKITDVQKAPEPQ